MGNVNQTDRELFRRALQEAFIRKFDRELENCPFSTTCSEAHTRCMQEILAQSSRTERRKDRRKWVVALLVAAALLLTACTVYAYREEIRAYIERVFSTHITITYVEETDGEVADTLAEMYTLGYVPEGYELVSQVRMPSVNQYRWKNEKGEDLVFEQYDLSGADYIVNSESGEISVIICGEYEVYSQVAGVTTYVWNDGRYAYKIKSSVAISDGTLNGMVNSLVAVE